MIEDMNGYRKLFWKEMSNVKGGKVKCCSRVKDGNRRLVQGEDEVGRIWKEYFEDPHNIDTQEHVSVHMCGLDGIWRGNYFGGEPIRIAEVEVRVGKLKNRKATGQDEITGDMIKGGGDSVVGWIWRMCNMAFESGCSTIQEEERVINVKIIEVLLC